MIRRRLLPCCLLALLLLAACDLLPRQAVPTTPVPTPPAYHWDERASVVLIRSDRFSVPLSDADFAARVPACAVFGDGRVRWVEPPDAAALAQGALGRLLESRVDPAALAALLERVIDSGFFTLEPVIGPNLGPVRELLVRVEGLGTHTVQVADITAAPAAFDTLFGACESLRQPEEAQEIIPTAGWLHVFPLAAPGDVRFPWPPDAPDLAALVDQPRWYANEAQVAAIWAAQRDYGARASFWDGERAYRVILRVEGITLDTPREPRDPAAPLPPTTPWYPAAEARVFTAWLIGGLPGPYRTVGLNAMPACSIFGDGRVIVSEQPIGRVQVGKLSRTAMQDFLDGWIESGFFDDAPAMAAVPPDRVQQVVTIQLRERELTRTFTTTSAYVRSVRNPCAGIAALVPYEPEAGYLSAERIGPADAYEGDIDYALVPWPEEYPPLRRLATPTWQEDGGEGEATANALRFAWAHLHGLHGNPNVLFTQQGSAYAVYASVPGVNMGLVAPTMPAAEEGAAGQ